MSNVTTNYTTAIFLVRDDVRCVAISYEPDPAPANMALPRAQQVGKRPFVNFKTMDPNLKVGDHVTFPSGTRWGFTTGRVEEVDVEIDFRSMTPMDWIIERVDPDANAEVVEMEKNGIVMVKHAEKERAKKELREKLLEANPELQQLAAMKPGSALPAPPAPEVEPSTERGS